MIVCLWLGLQESGQDIDTAAPPHDHYSTDLGSKWCCQHKMTTAIFQTFWLCKEVEMRHSIFFFSFFFTVYGPQRDVYRDLSQAKVNFSNLCVTLKQANERRLKGVFHKQGFLKLAVTVWHFETIYILMQCHLLKSLKACLCRQLDETQ